MTGSTHDRRRRRGLAFDARRLFAQQPLVTRAIPSTRRADSGHRARQLRDLLAGGAQRRRDGVARRAQGAARQRRDGLRHGARLRRVGGSRGEDRRRDRRWADRLFWATKLNVAGARRLRRSRGRAGAGRDVVPARRQGEDRPHPGAQPRRSEGAAADPAASSSSRGASVRRHHHDVRQPVRRADQRSIADETLDFIGVDYAIDNRDVEATILPLAQERKMACSPTRRSAAPVCSSASATGRCPTGPRSSTRRRGRSSS